MNNWKIRKNEKIEGLKVDFLSGTTINIGSITKKVKNVEIVNMIDDIKNKKVTVTTSDGVFYTLWKDDEYDRIGNWTNEDVVAKVKELILNQNS